MVANISIEDAKVIADALEGSVMAAVLRIIDASVEDTHKTLFSATNDRDEHIAIGELRGFKALYAALAGAPLLVADKAKSRQEGNSPYPY